MLHRRFDSADIGLRLIDFIFIPHIKRQHHRDSISMPNTIEAAHFHERMLDSQLKGVGDEA
jgi:hypothetical protein